MKFSFIFAYLFPAKLFGNNVETWDELRDYNIIPKFNCYIPSSSITYPYCTYTHITIISILIIFINYAGLGSSCRWCNHFTFRRSRSFCPSGLISLLWCLLHSVQGPCAVFIPWQSSVSITHVNLTRVVQWLTLAVSKTPNWVGVFSPPPFTWGRKLIKFPKRRVSIL
jgi:hypothetical protein